MFASPMRGEWRHFALSAWKTNTSTARVTLDMVVVCGEPAPPSFRSPAGRIRVLLVHFIACSNFLPKGADTLWAVPATASGCWSNGQGVPKQAHGPGLNPQSGPEDQVGAPAGAILVGDPPTGAPASDLALGFKEFGADVE